MTCADGMLYCLTEDEGTVALVKASPDGWNEVSRFTLSPLSEVRSSRRPDLDSPGHCQWEAVPARSGPAVLL